MSLPDVGEVRLAARLKGKLPGQGGTEIGAVYDLAAAALRHAIAGGGVALALAACSSAGTTPSAAAGAPSFAPTASSTTSALTPASTPAWPVGEPVPATLAGVWYFPLRSSTITLTGTDYRVVQTAPSNAAHGNVVVAGDEIDFFNGSGCGVPLPNGVGRYRWTIRGTMSVHFTALNDDPCGRSEILRDATWKRSP